MKKLLFLIFPLLLALSGSTVHYSTIHTASDSLPAGTKINLEILVPGDAAATKFSYTVPASTTKPVVSPPVIVPPTSGLAVLKTIPNQSGAVGSPFSFVIPDDIFQGATSFDVSDLPPGLRWTGSTKTISGTPTSADSRTITVTGSDGGRFVQTRFVLSFASNAPPLPDKPVVDITPTAPVISQPAGTLNLATYRVEEKGSFDIAQFGTGKYYDPNYFFSIDFNPNRDNAATRKAQGISMFTPWVLPDRGEFDALPQSQKLYYSFESGLHGIYEGAKYYESTVEQVEAQYNQTVPGGGAYCVPNIETSTEWNQWRYGSNSHGYDSWDIAKNRSITCEIDGQVRTLEQLYNSGLWEREAQVRKANRDAVLARMILQRNTGFMYGSAMGQGEPRTNGLSDRSLFINGSPDWTHLGGDRDGNVTLNGRRYTGLNKNVFSYETSMLDYYYYFSATLSSQDYTDIFINKRDGTQRLDYIWSKLAPYHIAASEKGHWQVNRAKMNLPGQSVRGSVRMQEPFYEGDFYTENWTVRSAFMPFREVQNVSFGNWTNTPKVWLAPYLPHGAYTMHRFLEGDTPGSGYHLFNAPNFVLLPPTHPLYAHQLATITSIFQARDDLQFLEGWYAGSTLVEDPEVQINQQGEYTSYSGCDAFAFSPDGSRGVQKPAYSLRYKPESGGVRVVFAGGTIQDYTATHTDNIRLTLPGQSKPTYFSLTTKGPSVQVFSVLVTDPSVSYTLVSQTTGKPGFAGKAE